MPVVVEVEGGLREEVEDEHLWESLDRKDLQTLERLAGTLLVAVALVDHLVDHDGMDRARS